MSQVRDGKSAPCFLGLCHYFRRQLLCSEQPHLKRELVRQGASPETIWKEKGCMPQVKDIVNCY